MATASTSPPPSPSFSTSHFHWPTHPHSHHFPPHPHYHPYHNELDDQHISFDLPDIPASFNRPSHTAAFSPSTVLSPPDSPYIEPTDAATLFSTTATPYPSLSSPSASPSPSSSSSSSSHSSTPSPTTALPSTAAATDRQQSASRRRRRGSDEAQLAKDEAVREAAGVGQRSAYASGGGGVGPRSEYSARRLKHRAIDAARRAREQCCIARLARLTGRLTHIHTFDQQHSTPNKRRRAAAAAALAAAADTDRDEKKDKVSVLEEAADRMEALYELIEQLGEACTAHYDQSRSMVYQRQAATQQPFPQHETHAHTHVLRLLPSHSHTSKSSHTASMASTSSTASSSSSSSASSAYLSHAATSRHSYSQSLYSVFFLSASLPMLTVRCDTGQVLDVNTATLALSGWQAHHMIGKRITAPYEHIMNKMQWSYGELTAHEAALCYKGSERIMVEEKDGRMVHAKVHPQYDTSNEMERALYAGEVSVIQAVWRLQLKDGQLHELTATQWCGEWMEVPDGHGGTRRQPTYVVYVIAPESIVRLD